MSKPRYRYSRISRKKSSGPVSNSKQASSSFFDFGGEHSFFSGKSSEASVNRKCEACEKEEKKVHKKEAAATSAKASPGVSSQIKFLQGGASLNNSTRSFFEPKFSADFSTVRIHNDGKSNELASSVNAKAFTYKNNIVFNKGQYDTESGDGKKLLAHELTHVIQQNNQISKKETEKKEEEIIQRTPKDADFKIEGLDPANATNDTIIRFNGGQTMVPSEELGKLKRDAKPEKRDLSLTGFSSEEGTSKDNATVVGGRLFNVNKLLSDLGHQGKRDTIANTTAGEGIKEYRKMRTVEIVPTPAKGDPLPTSVPSSAVTTISCGADIPASFALATVNTLNAIVKLFNPTPAEQAIFKLYFGGNKMEDVRNNLFKIFFEIIRHSTAFNTAADCHAGSVDKACSSGAAAYCDTGLSPAKMVFCESALGYTTASKSEYIVHEASHGTPGLMTKDKGYENERMIRTLPDAVKLFNADNYLLLVRVLNDPAAVGYSSPADTIAGTTDKAEIDFANKALAFLEQWVWKSKYYSGLLYGEINNSLGLPNGWRDVNPLNYYIVTMHNFSTLFGLTDPGAANPLTIPKRDDKIRSAGIFDRYSILSDAMHNALTLEKSSKNKEGWAKNAGAKTEVLPSFFLKSDVDAVRHLLRLMAKSRSDIPSALVESYVKGADTMRAQEGVGP
jgi:hypothetical protein